MIRPIILALLWMQVGALAPARLEKGSIEGVVVRLGTKEPLENVRIVLLRPIDSEFPFDGNIPSYPQASTDAQGKFLLKDVEPGRYYLTLAANGYVRQQYGQRGFAATYPNTGTVINLAAGQTLKDLSIELTPTGTVSGTIRDPQKQALAGVPVKLMQVAYDENGNRRLRPAATITRTDDRGEFRIYYVTPGRYYLNAGTPPGPPGNGDPRPAANEVPEMFSYMYYPGTTDLRFATMIDVQPGDAKVGMDMTLNRLPGVRVAGRIIDAVTGQPPEKPKILLRYHDPVAGSDYYDLEMFGRAKVTYKDGVFEYRNIVPGVFTVVASMDEPGTPPLRPDGTRAPLQRSGYVPIEVGLSDVEGIVVTMSPGTTLNGRVRVEGEQPVSVGAFTNYPAGVRLDPSMNGGRPTTLGVPYPKSGLLNPDGTFRIDDVMPGEFRFVVNWSKAQYYVKQARFGTIDLLKQPLQFTGREQSTLEILMSPNVASIEGVVTDRFSPAKSAQVVLVPDQARYRSELFKFTLADQNGRFALRDLAPGDYHLYAWEAIDPYSWFDPEVTKRYEQAALPVHLAESARQTLNPQLIPAQ